jgi:hypothetical protein
MQTAPVKRKLKGVLGKATLTEVRLDRNKMYMPSWIQQVPPEVAGSRTGKLSADQWRTFATVNLVVTLIRLWGGLAEGSRYKQMLENFMDLAAAVKLSHMRSLTQAQIDEYTRLTKAYLEGLKELYPHASFVVKHHLSLHIGPLYTGFGPTHSWRTFATERMNHTLQRTNTNDHVGKEMFLTRCGELMQS